MFEASFKREEEEIVPGQACAKRGNHRWDGPIVIILGQEYETCSKCGGSRPA